MPGSPAAPATAFPKYHPAGLPLGLRSHPAPARRRKSKIKLKILFRLETTSNDCSQRLTSNSNRTMFRLDALARSSHGVKTQPLTIAKTAGLWAADRALSGARRRQAAGATGAEFGGDGAGVRGICGGRRWRARLSRFGRRICGCRGFVWWGPLRRRFHIGAGSGGCCR